MFVLMSIHGVIIDHLFRKKCAF